MSKLVEAAALGIALTCAVTALAQDAPRPSKPSAAKKAAPVPVSAAPAPALKNPDAIAGAELASAARRQAACLTRRAALVDKAAKALDSAADPESEAHMAAFDSLNTAVMSLGHCSTLNPPSLFVDRLEVPTDACNESLECEDIVNLPDAFAAAADVSSPALMKCYDLGLARNPDLAGRLVYEADLAEGKEARIAKLSPVEDTLGDRAVKACLDKEIKSLRFGPVQSTERVRFSLHFTPN
jgi:hypothetical protein